MGSSKTEVTLEQVKKYIVAKEFSEEEARAVNDLEAGPVQKYIYAIAIRQFGLESEKTYLIKNNLYLEDKVVNEIFLAFQKKVDAEDVEKVINEFGADIKPHYITKLYNPKVNEKPEDKFFNQVMDEAEKQNETDTETQSNDLLTKEDTLYEAETKPDLSEEQAEKGKETQPEDVKTEESSIKEDEKEKTNQNLSLYEKEEMNPVDQKLKRLLESNEEIKKKIDSINLEIRQLQTQLSNVANNKRRKISVFTKEESISKESLLSYVIRRHYNPKVLDLLNKQFNSGAKPEQLKEILDNEEDEEKLLALLKMTLSQK
ncbi:MAG: hypothetical protein E7242_01020 [Lachnospiraceae bacterium]|nr:hypothetical protein [Lachnospiraceae bacterium]